MARRWLEQAEKAEQGTGGAQGPGHDSGAVPGAVPGEGSGAGNGDQVFEAPVSEDVERLAVLAGDAAALGGKADRAMAALRAARAKRTAVIAEWDERVAEAQRRWHAARSAHSGAVRAEQALVDRAAPEAAGALRAAMARADNAESERIRARDALSDAQARLEAALHAPAYPGDGVREALLSEPNRRAIAAVREANETVEAMDDRLRRAIADEAAAREAAASARAAALRSGSDGLIGPARA